LPLAKKPPSDQGVGSRRRPWNTDKRSNKERAVNLEAVIKDDAEVLAMYRAEMLQESGKRNDLGNNITSDKRITGTSRAYSMAGGEELVAC
jgi:hypothetical protein